MNCNEAYLQNCDTLTFLWALTVAMYAIGGMVGGFSAGLLANKYGRFVHVIHSLKKKLLLFCSKVVLLMLLLLFFWCCFLGGGRVIGIHLSVCCTYYSYSYKSIY